MIVKSVLISKAEYDKRLEAEAEARKRASDLRFNLSIGDELFLAYHAENMKHPNAEIWVHIGTGENYRFDKFSNMSFQDKVDYNHALLEKEISNHRFPIQYNPYLPHESESVQEYAPILISSLTVSTKKLGEALVTLGLAVEAKVNDCKKAYKAYTEKRDKHYGASALEELDHYRACELWQDSKALAAIAGKNENATINFYDGQITIQTGNTINTYFV